MSQVTRPTTLHTAILTVPGMGAEHRTGPVKTSLQQPRGCRKPGWECDMRSAVSLLPISAIHHERRSGNTADFARQAIKPGTDPLVLLGIRLRF